MYADDAKEWCEKRNGWKIDFDKQFGFQCVDFVRQYSYDLNGIDKLVEKPTASAYQLFDNRNSKLYERVGRGAYKYHEGDIYVGSREYWGIHGHTGIIVGASNRSVYIYQQDGYAQHRGVFSSWVPINSMIGVLRPKRQRPAINRKNGTVVVEAVNYRDAPSLNGRVLRQFEEGQVLTFDGWKYGSRINGNRVWYRGAFTHGWVWSGAISEGVTVPNLNPEYRNAKTLANSNIREHDNLKSKINKVIPKGTNIQLDAWSWGERIENSAIWYHTNGGMIWSGLVSGGELHSYSLKEI